MFERGTSAINPLRMGQRNETAPEPCTVVIFGATGDLTSRKLVPALYNLARERRLPPGFSVVGFARRDWTDDFFRQTLLNGVNAHSRSGATNQALWANFAEGISYVRSDFTDNEGYKRLAEHLAQLDEQRGTSGNRVFYLATPPEAYDDIIGRLGEHGLNKSSGWTRIIIEKPFGTDLETAQGLNRQLLSVFDESQVYRMDHYLGKETVQNILVFRFANGIFEPTWNRRYIDHVQITVAETLGVEDRGSYYDNSGAMRDVVQNHMMQLLSLVAMEPPVAYDANAVRDEKVKVLRAIHPIRPDEVGTLTARGQYGRGSVAGEASPGYREEKGVDPQSQTETYVAMRMQIDNWRWAGVPFYLRTGKSLPRRVTEIAVQFKSVPLLLFAQDAARGIESNVLTMKIQPDEGITLKISSKVPGQAQIRPVMMDFRYGSAFGVSSPDAYERLILDCLLGDGTLFTRRDEVEASWALLTPILQAWENGPSQPFPNYEAGTWGPVEADVLLARDGRVWRRL